MALTYQMTAAKCNVDKGIHATNVTFSSKTNVLRQRPVEISQHLTDLSSLPETSHSPLECMLIDRIIFEWPLNTCNQEINSF